MARERTIHLGPDAFDFNRPYSPGSEGIVGTTKVPSTQVWRVPVGMPLVVALVGKQTATVDEGTEDQTVTLDPEAPLADYMDDVTAGEYTEDASLVGYFDSSGDGNPDTLITGDSTVQYTGTFSVADDFVTSVDVTDTSANAATKAVEFYAVMRHGLTTLQKRSTGKSNVKQELQSEDSLTFAFSNPDAPDTDRQVTWDGRNDGTRGVLPPKFNLDLVFYDEAFATALDSENAVNVEVSIPVNQRPLSSDEDPAALRRRVAQNMVA